ncbi:unnamed protein product, partial [Arabidopsis halleri]
KLPFEHLLVVKQVFFAPTPVPAPVPNSSTHGLSFCLFKTSGKQSGLILTIPFYKIFLV